MAMLVAYRKYSFKCDVEIESAPEYVLGPPPRKHVVGSGLNAENLLAFLWGRRDGERRDARRAPRVSSSIVSREPRDVLISWSCSSLVSGETDAEQCDTGDTLQHTCSSRVRLIK